MNDNKQCIEKDCSFYLDYLYCVRFSIGYFCNNWM